MESYIIKELLPLVSSAFPVIPDKQGICGHSMGGHGALTLALKYSDLFKSISAFSPIVAPSKVAWGQKAFRGYLGDNTEEWKRHDACELMKIASDRSSFSEILIDQGDTDDFLEDQLKPTLFQEACAIVNQKLCLNMRKGYDHSYFFIQSFIADHINHHALLLDR